MTPSRLLLAGWVCAPVVEALERAAEDIIRAGGRHVTVDLARLQGRDVPVLVLLAALSHRLRRERGCLHADGLDSRLASEPEVASFPELFGDVASPDGAAAHAIGYPPSPGEPTRRAVPRGAEGPLGPPGRCA